MAPPSPKESLLQGTKILSDLLVSHGYAFQFNDEGIGSGGPFASGAFVRDDRQLELHYRGGLGLVVYHLAADRASHERYLRELGVWGQNRYPGVSTEHLQGFRDLLHDLSFTTDFLSGDGRVLVSAAHNEATADAAHREQLVAGYVGDTRATQEMQTLFRSKRYAEVVAIFDSLKFPQLLSGAQLRLVELARERAHGG